MAAKRIVLCIALLLPACSGVKSVQLRPPVDPPADLMWGYGVEKVGKDAMKSRESAYFRALEDLLTRGPVLVSRTVDDRTSVTNVKSVNRSMASTFRLRASSLLQPAFMDSGVQEGFAWVLVGTTEADVEQRWHQFLEWRAGKIDQAHRPFSEAAGPERVSRLKASFALLEEAGAQDDPSSLYHEVKAALDAEIARIAKLENLEKETRRLIATGQLALAEASVDHAVKLGLDAGASDQYRAEINARRHESAALVRSADELFHGEQYREALEKYQRAQSLDRDNPDLVPKLAAAERFHRAARGQTILSAIGTIGITAGHAVGEYFEYKREQERRKRIEAERAEREAESERPRRERRRGNDEDGEVPDSPPPPPEEESSPAPHQ